ncbi:unnamed protein product [Ectocarpus sp. 12 AP-2014]
MAPASNIGSRAQVMHGTAKRTSGGLEKHDLAYNKSGSIVSKKKSLEAKKSENGLLKLWRKAMKEISSSPMYKDKFVKPKRGSTAHAKVFAEYERLVHEKYGATHSVRRVSIDGLTKIVIHER